MSGNDGWGWLVTNDWSTFTLYTSDLVDSAPSHQMTQILELWLLWLDGNQGNKAKPSAHGAIKGVHELPEVSDQ